MRKSVKFCNSLSLNTVTQFVYSIRSVLLRDHVRTFYTSETTEVIKVSFSWILRTEFLKLYLFITEIRDVVFKLCESRQKRRKWLKQHDNNSFQRLSIPLQTLVAGTSPLVIKSNYTERVTYFSSWIFSNLLYFEYYFNKLQNFSYTTIFVVKNWLSIQNLK